MAADTERQFIGAPNYSDFGQQYTQPQYGVEYSAQVQTQPAYAEASLPTQWPPAPSYPVSNPLPYPISFDYNYGNTGLSLVDPYPVIPTITRQLAASSSARIEAENKFNTGDYHVWQAGAFPAPDTSERQGQSDATAQMAGYHPVQPTGMTLWAPQPLHALPTAPFIQRAQYEDMAYYSPPARVPAPQLALHVSATPSKAGAAHAGLTKLGPTSQAVREGRTTLGGGSQPDRPVRGYSRSRAIQSASSVRLSVAGGALTLMSGAVTGSQDTGASTASSNARSTFKDTHDAPGDIPGASDDVPDASDDVPDASDNVPDASAAPDMPNNVRISSSTPDTTKVPDSPSVIASPCKVPTDGVIMKAAASGAAKKKKVKAPPAPQFMACFFCRSRKIACGHPPPDDPDRTCNQCAKRGYICIYPTVSRRGRRRPQDQVASEGNSSSSVVPQVRHNPRRRYSPY